MAKTQNTMRHDKPLARRMGELAPRLRLITGLVLFSFVLGHFLNHALGLISVGAMEAMADVRRTVWQTLPGTVLLYGSLVLHMVLALWKTLYRRTWRMPLTEAAQLFLGLAIPIMLIDHIVGTRLLDALFDIEDSYVQVLSLQWPGLALWQSTLLVIVWAHAMIGLYYWLRYRSWFKAAAPILLTLAVLIPVLSVAGWIEASRRLVLAGEAEKILTREAILWSDPVITWGRWVLIALVAGAVLVSLAISFGLFDRNRIAITYPGGRTVRARRGQTLLEISRENGIAHTSVCGGRARCSTCRTRIVDGLRQLPDVEPAENAVLKRIAAGPGVRLACQLRPRGNIKVQPLFPAVGSGSSATDDSYRWGMEEEIAILFVDIRGFTALSERRLPFDVVFILNEYLGTMAKMVTTNGGIVDKFIGDSVMALFGITNGPGSGCRDALLAAAAMMDAMEPLNQKLNEHLSEELRIGIGIHAGPAILGRVGVGGGAAGGITALGDTVNTASRLEGSTKEFGTMLAVSDAVTHFAGIDTSDWPAESIVVRGRTEPLVVHPIATSSILRQALGRAGAKRAA